MFSNLYVALCTPCNGSPSQDNRGTYLAAGSVIKACCPDISTSLLQELPVLNLHWILFSKDLKVAMGLQAGAFVVISATLPSIQRGCTLPIISTVKKCSSLHPSVVSELRQQWKTMGQLPQQPADLDTGNVAAISVNQALSSADFDTARQCHTRTQYSTVGFVHKVNSCGCHHLSRLLLST